MANTTSLAKGVALKRNGKMYFVIENTFVNPGKGAAFFRTKLREISTGKVIENTFKSGESIDLLETENRKATFLYQQDKILFFMDQENYEQYEVNSENISPEMAQFLKDGVEVFVFFAEGEIVDINFEKAKIAYKVTDAPPAVKGDSVSNNYRVVTIETGAKINVPMFIKEGESIVINVKTGEYAGREKE